MIAATAAAGQGGGSTRSNSLIMASAGACGAFSGAAPSFPIAGGRKNGLGRSAVSFPLGGGDRTAHSHPFRGRALVAG